MGVAFVRCYFLRGSQISGFEVLPGGLSDHGAVEKADRQSLKRRVRSDDLEIWDGSRLVLRRFIPLPGSRWVIVQW
jgi:hypothetical protein